MALKLWKEKERGNLEQVRQCTLYTGTASHLDPQKQLCKWFWTCKPPQSLYFVHYLICIRDEYEYILTFKMIWIMEARNILGRKRKLSNVGSVVTLTFGLSNLPSSDRHSHSYWEGEGGGSCALKEPLCVVFLRMKMDMLESETRRLEALYGLKAKRPFYYCGTWCITTLLVLRITRRYTSKLPYWRKSLYFLHIFQACPPSLLGGETRGITTPWASYKRTWSSTSQYTGTIFIQEMLQGVLFTVILFDQRKKHYNCLLYSLHAYTMHCISWSPTLQYTWTIFIQEMYDSRKKQYTGLR